MKKYLTLSQLLGLAFLLFILVSACKKENFLGANQLSPDEKVEFSFSDTTTVKAHTVRADTIVTSNVSTALIGSCSDPVFGSTKAEFLSRFILSEIAPDFGDNPVVDSMTLFLAYKTDVNNINYKPYYGKPATPQDLKVFELNKNIHDTINYFAYYKATDYYSGNELGSLTYIVGDDVENSTGTVAIKFTDLNIGNKLLQADEETLKDDSLFFELINGLCITADESPVDAAIVFFDLFSEKTKLAMYYHNDTDTLAYNLYSNIHCTRFNVFSHDYSNSPFSEELDNPDAPQAEKLYVQGVAGVQTKFTFPFVKEWAKLGTISIINAELNMEVDISDIESFSPPDKLMVVRKDEALTEVLLTEYFSGDAYYGESFNSTDNKYIFNITDYIQKLVEGDFKDNGLFVQPLTNKISPNRTIFEGTVSTKPLKLKITYTVVK